MKKKKYQLKYKLGRRAYFYYINNYFIYEKE